MHICEHVSYSVTYVHAHKKMWTLTSSFEAPLAFLFVHRTPWFLHAAVAPDDPFLC